MFMVQDLELQELMVLCLELLTQKLYNKPLVVEMAQTRDFHMYQI